MTKSRAWNRAAAVLALAVGTVSPTPAQSPVRPTYQPTAAAGLALGQRLCANCHVVESQPAVATPSGVPSFRAIANRPGQTGARIRDMLIAPPHQMPDMQLSLDEIADLLAYLDSLRPAGTEPLGPPGPGPGKPTFPKPS